MPIATTTALAIAGLGMGAAQFISSQNAQKKANQAAAKAADDYSKITEQNPWSAVQVPTLGFDLAQQGIDRQTAASVNALQGIGAEGVIGGIGTVAAQNNQSELELAAQANELEYQRNAYQAEAQSKINERKVGREEGLISSRISGAQAASAQAQANKNSAIAGMVGSLGSAVSSGITGSDLYKTQKAMGGIFNKNTKQWEFPEGTFDADGNMIKKSKNPGINSGADGNDFWQPTT